MIIGVPKEIKNNEFRVALTPAGVQALVRKGHRVLVERSTGIGSGIEDEEYAAQGACILTAAEDIFDQSDVIVKVKEPLEREYALLKNGQTLFTYLHLAPNPSLSSPVTLSTIVPRAVSRMTGTSFSLRMRRSTSMPLICGSITSSRIKSNGSCSASDKPERPSRDALVS